MAVKLKEAPKRVTIEVTADDIRLGKMGDGTRCAIARAVKRTMGDSPEVDDNITVTINDRTCYYILPKKASTFIERFDEDRKKVKPFSFVAKFDTMADGYDDEDIVY